MQLQSRSLLMALVASATLFATGYTAWADADKKDEAKAPAAKVEAKADAAAPAAAKPVATVNGVAIPAQRLEMLLKEAQARGQKDSPEMQANFRDSLITTEVLVQEAIKQGVDKKEEVKAQMEMIRSAVLYKNLIQSYVETHPITDEALKAKYEELKPQMMSKEFKARHILVEKEADAKKVLEQLKKGKKFEDLAKQFSKDPGSKDLGGDLGWQNPANFVPAFSEAMTKLQKGQITQAPVKTDYGFHVIQLQDARENAPTMDQVRPQLQNQLQSELVKKYVDGLRAAAKIVE